MASTGFHMFYMYLKLSCLVDQSDNVPTMPLALSAIPCPMRIPCHAILHNHVLLSGPSKFYPSSTHPCNWLTHTQFRIASVAEPSPNLN